ncbi:hypothetical protein [Stenotrophomonas sp. PS02298]|uniref:hypothetical protein n=1 Tax=Stenotrophomonas sp. PS02298 TaxID=2991424 RepID=UPI00249BC9C4|nr:hypothetical protein [Stenotrophomonas sp. PS02298]
MNRIPVFIVIALLSVSTSGIAAEQPEVRAGKEVVTRNFSDPLSAQFRNLSIARGKEKVRLCGEVNAKNAFGAYVGFRRFATMEDTALIENPADPPTLAQATLNVIDSLCKDATPVVGEAST